MDVQVIAALISMGGTGLVAVIGIVGSAVSQRKASDHARRDAMELFERQAQDQREARAEEALERRQTTFLTERKQAYGNLLRYVDKYTTAIAEHDVAQAAYDVGQAQGGRADQVAVSAVVESHRALIETLDGLVQALEAVRLLAPAAVANAATTWVKRLREGGDADEAAERFLLAARVDVGADGPRSRSSAARRSAS
jgi:hypothetical protein